MERRITSLSEQIDKHLSELQDKYNDMMELARIATAFLALQIEVLQAFVSGHVFENETEEIAFFKDINPCFYSKYIYYQHISHIESRRRPGGSPDLQQISFIIYHLIIILPRRNKFPNISTEKAILVMVYLYAMRPVP